ncbi:M4 family metallopeptidase [Amnibacterium sp. CER49]|uniref:M4 family metallopeptidase n=1 Tax=Amnibacterium sp. CER49 TaxID=3039161 RepID=UPI00244A399C|nr:M4 family metallopeptidase [Amnibacterium sp. CER49]MDH2442994.1 M4 family metallopeptidase [Amnibacterium sp. CER49]
MSHAYPRCGIVPPYILEALADHGDDRVREAARRTLGLSAELGASRFAPQPPARTAVAPAEDRRIYDGHSRETLPGTLVRREGWAPTSDVAVNEAYDGLGATWSLYEDVYGRNSIDGNGMPLLGTVHFGQDYDNAYWDGSQMVFGDGDGVLFNRFTIAVDVMGHELTHGVTGALVNLEYQGQSGALNESVSDVFGSLVKQRTLGQTAEQADWLIGAGLLASDIDGAALRSMKAPGTAYDDPQLGGRDPQPATMSGYVRTSSDNGGVHTNSGIPNHAFYLAAVALGGNAWEKAGHIWFSTISSTTLSSTATFAQFAAVTAQQAAALYGATEQQAVADAWRQVGVQAD